MRSAISVTIALVVLAAVAPAARADALPEAQLLLLSPETTVAELAQAGLSPGLMSAGLGKVPAAQTYLDISQGNRVFNSLYDEDLPPRDEGATAWWQRVKERAESAPAEIVPGLLRSSLREAGIPARRLDIRKADLRSLPTGPQDLVIALARPTGQSDAPLPIGIAGAGFEGNLTSDSTRIDGYVLSTDLAPTILEHFGVAVPPEMSGQPIRSEGKVDAAAIEALGARMAVISHRRGPVIGLNIVIWLAALALLVLLSRGRLARACGPGRRARARLPPSGPPPGSGARTGGEHRTAAGAPAGAAPCRGDPAGAAGLPRACARRRR